MRRLAVPYVVFGAAPYGGDLVLTHGALAVGAERGRFSAQVQKTDVLRF